MGGKGGSIVRNNYKGHTDKPKEGQDQDWEVGMAEVG